ncbi:MAG: hypothetical protein Kapaf2KO_19300 [Candidatus Kapaibacteriales bacterium]
MKLFLSLAIVATLLVSCDNDTPVDKDEVEKEVVSTIFEGLQPIAEWNFDNEDVTDRYGNYDGTLMSPDMASFEDGIRGKAIRLDGGSSDNKLDASRDGTGAYIDIPFIDFNQYDVFGMELWVKGEDMSYLNGQMLLFFGDITSGWAGIGHHTMFPNVNNDPVYHFSAGSYLNDITGFSYNPGIESEVYAFDNNEWVKLSMLYIDGHLTAYINDLKVGYIKQDINVQGTKAGIAKHYWDNGRKECVRFTGLIDDVKIYAGLKPMDT